MWRAPRRHVNDYLHRCLALHGRVAQIRYGRTQRLDLVERDVREVLGRRWLGVRQIVGQ